MKNKRGVSPVIATVLLVLITFMAVGLIWAFILPMIKEGLEGGASCFELRDYAEIVDSAVYSCYTSANTSLMIKRGMEDYTIKGFAVSIFTEGESKRYDLEEGKNYGELVKMLDGSSVIKLPGPGEARTYLFNVTNGKNVELAVISEGGEVCKIDSYSIPACKSY